MLLLGVGRAAAEGEHKQTAGHRNFAGRKLKSGVRQNGAGEDGIANEMVEIREYSVKNFGKTRWFT